MIELRDVSVAYGSLVAVHPVSLSLPSGALVALTGPSGAGKTSLLTAIAGGPDHTGEILIDGDAVSDHADALAVGVVLIPQGNGLARMLTAVENIALPLGVRRPGGVADPVTEASAALDRLGLAESGNHLVEELSGGQQQRVAVARGLALRGTVLLADESTSELDPANRERVLDLLRAEADRGATVLFASNDLEAAAECDAHAALDEGHLTWARPLQRG